MAEDLRTTVPMGPRALVARRPGLATRGTTIGSRVPDTGALIPGL